MSNIIPFNFRSNTVRVIQDDSGEPWFLAQDVANILGYSRTNNMTKLIDGEDKKNSPILQNGANYTNQTLINESGLYTAIFGSTLPQAKSFKRWVTSELLPTIRKTGSYNTPDAAQETGAAGLLPTWVNAALSLGLDKNSAAISANQVVFKLTGTNVMSLLGATHLLAEKQELVYTPRELGSMLGISAQKINKKLAELGLQIKEGCHWKPTDKASGLFRLFDTGKAHSDGAPVLQVKWFDSVLTEMR